MQACTDLKSLKEICIVSHMAQCPSELSYVLDASGNADTDFPFPH